MQYHGGDVYRNKDVRLDFSINTNPLGVPPKVLEAARGAVELLGRYPDPQQEELKKKIADVLVCEPDEVLVGNGASELFLDIVFTFMPKKIGVVTPSFGGYKYAAEACGADLIEYPLKEKSGYEIDDGISEMLDSGIDLLFLATPNNPTGRTIPLPLLERILKHCQRKNIIVVMDESFMDLCDKVDDYEDFFFKSTFDNVVRVSAFTKSFAMAGVRLGFLRAPKKITSQIARHQSEWNVSILAEKCGADVFVIDAGMREETYPEKQLVTGQVVDRKVRRGSGDIAVEDAMSPGQCRQALHAGEDLVRELAEKGYDIAAVGEMGIGNTTPSAVLIGHFLHKNAETVTGRGAGLSDEGLAKKTRVVAQALERLAGVTDPVQALAAGGGLEIAMMAGVYLGGAKYHMPVIMDGVISQAAALAAVMIDPQVRKILIPSHRSGESCGTYVLAALDLSPVIDGDMSLGEGSGAVMLLPLLDAALAVYTRMSSFADCRIKPYKRFGETS